MVNYSKIDVIERTADAYLDAEVKTVRAVGTKLGISKSTVYDRLMKLKKINNVKYEKVREILDKNKAERHLRGGIKTKLKYQNKMQS